MITDPIEPDPAPGIDPLTASAVVDLAAFSRNIRRLRDHVDRTVMVVVKANGYGHGMITCARAARQAGADWIGAATPTEALRIRQSGDVGRLLCWLYGSQEDLTAAVAADIDLTVHHVGQLAMINKAVAAAGRPARVQLKIDTGLSRNGSPAAAWPQLCRLARQAETDQILTVTGIWSHLAAADEPGHPSIEAQLDAFAHAVHVAEETGLTPEVRHIANSAAALTLPNARYDLVRLGIACYGVEPGPGIAAGVGVDLEPVMTLRAQLAAVKPIKAGDGVSYGHTWVADRDTVVGLVPLGYGDGIPVAASNRGQVQVGGRRAPIRGRICMDQFVVDLGPEATDRIGDEVIIFSGPQNGPTAEDWAQACSTIGYEMITRIGSRVPRIYR